MRCCDARLVGPPIKPDWLATGSPRELPKTLYWCFAKVYTTIVHSIERGYSVLLLLARFHSNIWGFQKDLLKKMIFSSYICDKWQTLNFSLLQLISLCRARGYTLEYPIVPYCSAQAYWPQQNLRLAPWLSTNCFRQKNVRPQHGIPFRWTRKEDRCCRPKLQVLVTLGVQCRCPWTS